jgi:hypothetical protein
MNLEITPEPTDAERAAIAAALAQEAEPRAQPWDEGDAGDCEESVKP